MISSLPYNLFGENPSLLIDSGIHGDEFEIIEAIKKTLERYKSSLPSYLYIPNACPSAIETKNRLNKDGIDFNRMFQDNTNYEEVLNYMNLVRQYKFRTYLSFHEDSRFSAFYLYDSEYLEGTEKLETVRQEILKLDVPLYTGVDDITDPALGYDVHNGYSFSPVKEDDFTTGSWMYRKGIVERVITPEIPGKISLEKKYQLVEVMIKWMVEQV